MTNGKKKVFLNLLFALTNDKEVIKMDINYIEVNDKKYLSREFEYTDKNLDSHWLVVADETLLDVIKENDSVDTEIYAYMPIDFLIETLLEDDEDFAKDLSRYISLDI